MMDLVQLRSFAEVAERGTVAAAAERLGYSPPAVSQHIAKLEIELGASLFDRVAGRLRLTASGTKLLPITLQMIDLETLGRAAVAQRVEIPNFRIAGLASAISTVVVPRIDVLRDHFTLVILEAEDMHATRDLVLGAVDVVLIQEYQGMTGSRDKRLLYSPLTNDRLKLVLPAGASPATRVQDLADERWILNGTDTRCTRATHQILNANGLSPSIAGNVGDNSTLLDLVGAGHGVTIVPELVLNSQHHDLVVADQDFDIVRTILAVTRRVMSATTKPLLDILQSPIDATSSELPSDSQ